MLIFLKLGGSLITDKAAIHKPRRRVIRRLLKEIQVGMKASPDLRIVLGHGSGSFGHVPAKKYATIQGVSTPDQWMGFVEVWREAHALNQIMMDELAKAELPAISFPPSAMIRSENRTIPAWDPAPIQNALSSGIIPVVFGDVVFDRALGGTILSTEDLFIFLAQKLNPSRILLAGEEEGVWRGFPVRDELIPLVTPVSFEAMAHPPAGSRHTDVTGGMLQKVRMMTNLVDSLPGVSVSIFTGAQPGVLLASLRGETPGTTIRNHA